MARKKKQQTHGGTREGAGRKPGEPTVRIRVPVSKLEEVLKLIKPDQQDDCKDVREENEQLKKQLAALEALQTFKKAVNEHFEQEGKEQRRKDHQRLNKK